jgi:hypothetical protein
LPALGAALETYSRRRDRGDAPARDIISYFRRLSLIARFKDSYTTAGRNGGAGEAE